MGGTPSEKAFRAKMNAAFDDLQELNDKVDKEQSARLDALEKRLSGLEKRLSDMETEGEKDAKPPEQPKKSSK